MTPTNFLTFACILLGLICVARGQYEIHVDALSGIDIQHCGNISHPCHTIRFAVDLAFGADFPAGSNINIRLNSTSGPFTEPPNAFVTIPPAAITQTPALINVTGDDFHKAIIDCKGEEGWTVKLFSGLMEFRGLEFRNCTTAASNEGRGGCVYLLDNEQTRPASAAHRFEHVNFDHCVAEASGGALYISSSTRIDFADVSFTNNEVMGTDGSNIANGGAAYIEITASNTPIFYERGFVRNNFVHGSGNMQIFGAGFYIRAGINVENVSNVEMLSVEFTGNKLDIHGTNDSAFGGGMYLADFGGDFVDVKFDGNTAKYGGGIFFTGHNKFLDLCASTISIVNNQGWGLYVILGEARTWEEKMTGNVPEANRATAPGVISECKIPPPFKPDSGNKTGIIVAVFVVLLAVAIGVAIGGYYFYKKRVAYRTV